MSGFDRWGVCQWLDSAFAWLPVEVDSRSGRCVIWFERYFRIRHARESGLSPFSQYKVFYSVLGVYKTKWDAREHYRGRRLNWNRNKKIFAKFGVTL